MAKISQRLLANDGFIHLFQQTLNFEVVKFFCIQMKADGSEAEQRFGLVWTGTLQLCVFKANTVYKQASLVAAAFSSMLSGRSLPSSACLSSSGATGQSQQQLLFKVSGDDGCLKTFRGPDGFHGVNRVRLVPPASSQLVSLKVPVKSCLKRPWTLCFPVVEADKDCHCRPCRQ